MERLARCLFFSASLRSKMTFSHGSKSKEYYLRKIILDNYRGPKTIEKFYFRECVSFTVYGEFPN